MYKIICTTTHLVAGQYMQTKFTLSTGGSIESGFVDDSQGYTPILFKTKKLALDKMREFYQSYKSKYEVVKY